MKLWLDDVRKPPDTSYVWCKSVEDALKSVRETRFEEWALDHDLGGQLAHYGKGPYDYQAKTGFNFLQSVCLESIRIPSVISIHSTNLDGVANMIKMIASWCNWEHKDIEIIYRPERGRIMDKTPYYEDR